MIIDDVCTPEHLEILKFTNINHSWENMIEGQFSSLEELLILVNGLKDRMKELGFLDVANRQFICLDTGHLNIWRNKHFSKIKADQEIERFMPEIGALLKVYHIHANDGRSDNHISLFSRLFEEHPSRKGINWEEFEASSKRIQEWITVCDSYKKVDGRHIHLEVDKVPFSLEQIIDFGKWYSTII
jgi:hypothetical protein